MCILWMMKDLKRFGERDSMNVDPMNDEGFGDLDYQTGLSGLCQIFCSSSIIEYLPDWFIWGHYYKYHIETKNNQDKFVENELSQKLLNLLKMAPI